MGSGSISLIGQKSLKLLCAEFNEPDCHLPEESAEGLCTRWMESLIDLGVAPGKQSENQSRMWNQSNYLFIEQAVPLSWWSDQRRDGNICSIWLPQIKTHGLEAWKRKLVFFFQKYHITADFPSPCSSHLYNLQCIACFCPSIVRVLPSFSTIFYSLSIYLLCYELDII